MGLEPAAGLVLGLSLSVASTVVLLRGLTDRGLVSTPHGRVAIGWLVFEDLFTIVILVLMPVLAAGGGNPLVSVGAALLKTAVFVALMLLVGTRLLSWLLTQIAYTRSRELFILAVVAMALGTAFAAFELFGVSLALGAFLAGVVVGESDIHHQVGAEVVPFRDFFSVLFFVSVGMLVDPAVVAANIGKVLALSLLVIAGKAVLTLALGLVLPSSARTMIVVAAGLSQIGEFSFIVGQSGVALGLLDNDQYGLILAAAVISIIVNPLMFRLIQPVEKGLRASPGCGGAWSAAGRRRRRSTRDRRARGHRRLRPRRQPHRRRAAAPRPALSGGRAEHDPRQRVAAPGHQDDVRRRRQLRNSAPRRAGARPRPGRHRAQRDGHRTDRPPPPTPSPPTCPIIARAATATAWSNLFHLGARQHQPGDGRRAGDAAADAAGPGLTADGIQHSSTPCAPRPTRASCPTSAATRCWISLLMATQRGASPRAAGRG